MTRPRTRWARSPPLPRRSGSPPPPRLATTIAAATTNKPESFALFETAIGRCALAWRGGLVVGAALPDRSDDNLRRHLSRRFPRAEETEPSGEAAVAIRLVVELLHGGRPNLLDIALDLSRAPPFDSSVYEAARRIPPGEVRSYGDLAAQIGAPGAAQAVGRSLGRNPVPIIVPCHRVLAARGGSGGFTAPGGIETKFRILEIEGARRTGGPELFPSLPLTVRPSRA